MPVQVFEDVLELDIELLEATSLNAGGPRRESYPYPFLTKTGKRQLVSTPILVVENDFTLFAVAPKLGGRIIQLLDKRTGLEVIPKPEKLDIKEGGRRGAVCEYGIRWTIFGERENDLGPVDFMVVEPDNVEDGGGLWLHELRASQSASAHVGLFLTPESADIRFEIRSFNRSHHAFMVAPEFTVPASFEHCILGPRAEGYYDDVSDVGVALIPGENQPDLGLYIADRLAVRQLHTRKGSLVPLAGLGGLTAIGNGVGAFIGGNSVSLSFWKPEENLKLILNPKSGPALEAKIIPSGMQPLSIEMPSQETVGIAVLNAQKQELLRWDASAEPYESQMRTPRLDHEEERKLNRATCTILGGTGIDDSTQLRVLSNEIGLRAAALSLLGIKALQDQRYEDAADLFDDALLYNAEDHFTWFGKAVALRLAGNASEESPELLNAHYLAPLEPLLRAEAFFRQPEGVDGSALIARIAEDPDHAIEVACVLYEWQLFGDLAKWVDAALRHREIPMLRYILAAALLKNGGMDAEAAAEVHLAADKPINPPYPSRSAEFGVLVQLQRRFPEDARIRDLVELWIWSCGPDDGPPALPGELNSD